MKGYKRCKCRDANGREVGSGCPSLRRADGSWNPSHGTWYAKHELPPAPDGSRLCLRQGGFATQGEMSAWFEEAFGLLSIPERGPNGHQARVEILNIIKESRKRKEDLPDYDDVRRRYQAGAAFQPGTTGEFLLSWLEQRRTAGNAKRNTLRGYESHHHARVSACYRGHPAGQAPAVPRHEMPHHPGSRQSWAGHQAADARYAAEGLSRRQACGAHRPQPSGLGRRPARQWRQAQAARVDGGERAGVA